MSAHAHNRHLPRKPTGARNGLTVFAGAHDDRRRLLPRLGGIAALFNDKVYVGIHLALATCARDA
jgi:hypothetical protein